MTEVMDTPESISDYFQFENPLSWEMAESLRAWALARTMTTCEQDRAAEERYLDARNAYFAALPPRARAAAEDCMAILQERIFERAAFERVRAVQALGRRFGRFGPER